MLDQAPLQAKGIMKGIGDFRFVALKLHQEEARCFRATGVAFKAVLLPDIANLEHAELQA